MAVQRIEQTVRAAVARMEALLAGSYPAGWCAACGQPVSSRQKAVMLPGRVLWAGNGSPGLLLPGPTFHTRRLACWIEAERHEQRLLAADPDLRRQVTCPGIAYQHTDGARECTAGGDCTGHHGPPDRLGRVGLDCATRVVTDAGELPGPWGVCGDTDCRGRG